MLTPEGLAKSPHVMRTADELIASGRAECFLEDIKGRNAPLSEAVRLALGARIAARDASKRKQQ
jgi:hypothetical protein